MKGPPIEAIRNPDLQAIIALGQRHGVPILVDSTFTTPCLIKPLELGAASVIHSATKYLGGHGDVTGGVVACATEVNKDRARKRWSEDVAWCKDMVKKLEME